MKRTKQARDPRDPELQRPRHGGRRPGAGRKPKGLVAGASHSARPTIAAEHPLLVTQELCADLPSLRQLRELAVVQSVIAVHARQDRFRIVHFSLGADRLHFVCEAKSARRLIRTMRALSVALARRLNRLWGREGRVFADRYRARTLESPSAVRDALAELFLGGESSGPDDAFTSAAWFDGWKSSPTSPRGTTRDRRHGPTRAPVVPPRTWLLRVGWRRHGLLDPRVTSRAQSKLAAGAHDVRAVRRNEVVTARRSRTVRGGSKRSAHS